MTEDAVPSLQKTPTGIEGFDALVLGGLPQGRITVIAGAAGTGKTIFALQSLAYGAIKGNEPGVFVAFEEDADSVIANAASFGWALQQFEAEGRLAFVDARLSPDTVRSGEFDFEGLLAAVGAQVDAIGAKRVVLDAPEVLLRLLPDPLMARLEMQRVNAWLARRQVAGLITTQGDSLGESIGQGTDYLRYLADCVVLLRQQVVAGTAVRELRVAKYRGSAHDGNEHPFIISPDEGIVVGGEMVEGPEPVSMERVSTGIDSLDTMLDGGYFRGSSVLITGRPGTAKTTLSAAFLAAACDRGERSLFVTFDEDGREVVRNMHSVGISLESHVDRGCLRLDTRWAHTDDISVHLLAIRRLIEHIGARCVALDAVHTLLRTSGDIGAKRNTAEQLLRLVCWCKGRNVTVLATGLSEVPHGAEEASTEMRISTGTDVWIQLSYSERGGERNRALNIVKARGIPHSNQVRELILTRTGPRLTDVFSAGGEVLMGTQRLEKEAAVRAEAARHRAEARRREGELEAAEAELVALIKAKELELEARREERKVLLEAHRLEEQQREALRSEVVIRRGGAQPDADGDAS